MPAVNEPLREGAAFAITSVCMDVRRAVLTILISFALVLVGEGSALAAVHLDRSFGKGGLVLLPGKRSVPRRARPEAVAVAPGGALILANKREVERLGPAVGSTGASAGAGR